MEKNLGNLGGFWWEDEGAFRSFAYPMTAEGDDYPEPEDPYAGTHFGGLTSFIARGAAGDLEEAAAELWDSVGGDAGKTLTMSYPTAFEYQRLLHKWEIRRMRTIMLGVIGVSAAAVLWSMCR